MSSLSFETSDVLLSQVVSNQVPSALKGLTSVFGMGTGVSPSPSSLDSFFLSLSFDIPSILHKTFHSLILFFGQVLDLLVFIS